MNIVTKAAKKVIRDKFTAEIESISAKLHTLKAEAETAKADLEIQAITELLAKQHEILRKLRQSKE
jgi:3-hydroxyacyl-CoA dehydrogenase